MNLVSSGHTINRIKDFTLFINDYEFSNHPVGEKLLMLISLNNLLNMASAGYPSLIMNMAYLLV